MKTFLCYSLLACMLAGYAFGQDALSERYEQINNTTSVQLVGVPPPLVPVTSNAWEMWDVKAVDVSARTIQLLNGIERDEKLYPLPVSKVCEELMRANPTQMWDWIIDNFGALSPLGRARICVALELYPSMEGVQVLHALLKDERSQGLPRDPALGDPQFIKRVCDSASSSIEDIALMNDLDWTGMKTITPETNYEDRSEAIALVNGWWDRNQTVLKAKLPTLLTPGTAVQQKFATFMQQLAAE